MSTGESLGLEIIAHEILAFGPGAVSNARKIFRAAVAAIDLDDEASADGAVMAAEHYRKTVAGWNALLGLPARSPFVRDVDGQIRNLLAEAVEENA